MESDSEVATRLAADFLIYFGYPWCQPLKRTGLATADGYTDEYPYAIPRSLSEQGVRSLRSALLVGLMNKPRFHSLNIVPDAKRPMLTIFISWTL